MTEEITDIVAEAMAKAWDEGYRAASQTQTSALPNPYRELVNA